MATAVKETGIKPAAATQVTFLEAIKQAMYEEMERDPAVVLKARDGAFDFPQDVAVGRFRSGKSRASSRTGAWSLRYLSTRTRRRRGST